MTRIYLPLNQDIRMFVFVKSEFCSLILNRMRMFTLLAYMLLLWGCHGIPAEAPAKEPVYEPMEHGGLLYREYANRCNESERPALVIYLHSKHSSGNDNQKQLEQAAVRDIGNYISKNQIPAYFLVPQCPEDHEWDARDNRPGLTDKVENLITQYLGTKNIDVGRIYILGASMGACGVWRLVKDNPEMFAAAFVASGQSQRAYPSDFTTVPLYVTVGSQERSYEALKWFTSEITKAGGKVQFDILLGQRHSDACDNAFTSKRLKWLFSQVNSND